MAGSIEIKGSEGGEFSPITPEEVRGRIMSFFEGVDIAHEGNYAKGKILIDVTKHERLGSLAATANANGFLLASINRYFEPPYTTSVEDRIVAETKYILHGMYRGITQASISFWDKEGGLSKVTTILAGKTVDDSELIQGVVEWLGVRQSPYSDNLKLNSK
jgi:hypothetical protein